MRRKHKKWSEYSLSNAGVNARLTALNRDDAPYCTELRWLRIVPTCDVSGSCLTQENGFLCGLHGRLFSHILSFTYIYMSVLLKACDRWYKMIVFTGYTSYPIIFPVLHPYLTHHQSFPPTHSSLHPHHGPAGFYFSLILF